MPTGNAKQSVRHLARDHQCWLLLPLPDGEYMPGTFAKAVLSHLIFTIL